MEEEKKKSKAKWIAVLTIVAVLVLAYAIDISIRMTYQFEVMSISSDTIVADGKTPVEIEIELTQFGKPKAGHKLMAVATGGGSFKNQILLTDENGRATLIYTPYLATDYVKAGETELEILDYSNSIFVSVPCKLVLTLDLQMPEGGGGGSHTNEDIFG